MNWTPKIGDIVEMKEPYFDIPAGALMIVFRFSEGGGPSYALRPVSTTGKYSKTGYWDTFPTERVKFVCESNL